MAMHIYMEDGPGSGRLKYRGEAGPADDPQSFKRLMEARGFAVRIEAEKTGDVIDANAEG